MSREYFICSKAMRDLTKLWDHLVEESVTGANRMHARIMRAITKLAVNPHMGSACDEYREGVRHFTVQTRVIYYRIIDEGIEVLRVLHGSQDRDNIHFNA